MSNRKPPTPTWVWVVVIGGLIVAAYLCMKG